MTTAEKTVPRLKQRYRDEMLDKLREEFGYTNVMQIPGLTKVVVNMGVGDAARDSKLIDDLGLDSVAFAIGVVAIEERLGVKLSERELFESKTVGDLEDLIRSKAGTPA